MPVSMLQSVSQNVRKDIQVLPTRLSSPFIFILDLLSVTPVAIYSLRKMRATYTGFCIRVRRSSDSTLLDIDFVDNVINIARLLAFVGGGDGFVVTWYDQSGNARDATQATAASQPRVVNAGVLDIVNSKLSLSFDGANDVLAVPSISYKDATFSVVTRCLTSNRNPILWARNVTAPEVFDSLEFEFFGLNTVSFFARHQGDDVEQVLLTTTTQLSVVTAQNENLDTKIWANGVAGSMLSNSRTLSTVRDKVLTLGAINNGTIQGVGSWLQGNISETLIFPSALSTADRQLLETNQKTYYATP